MGGDVRGGESWSIDSSSDTYYSHQAGGLSINYRLSGCQSEESVVEIKAHRRVMRERSSKQSWIEFN